MAAKDADRQTTYIDLRGLKQILPLGTTTIWAHVAQGKLPKPFRLGGVGKSLWSRAEVEASIERIHKESHQGRHCHPRTPLADRKPGRGDAPAGLRRLGRGVGSLQHEPRIADPIGRAAEACGSGDVMPMRGPARAATAVDEVQARRVAACLMACANFGTEAIESGQAVMVLREPAAPRHPGSKQVGARKGYALSCRKGVWSGRYNDGSGDRNARTWRLIYRTARLGRVSKAQAHAMMRELVAQADKRRAGLYDPRAARRTEQARVTMREHAARWRDALKAKGRKPKYYNQEHDRVVRVMDLARIVLPADVTLPALESALARLSGPPHDYSQQSVQHHRRAMKSLLFWMLNEDKSIAENVLSRVKAAPVTEMRRPPRAFAPAEFDKFIEAVRPRGKAARTLFDGRQRAMFYELALATGFRRKEMTDLSGHPEWLVVGKDGAVATLPAGATKNKKPAVIPLSRGVAEAVEAWLAERRAAGKHTLFDIAPHVNLNRIFDTDLRHAEIPKRTPEGILYVHSLRHTAITRWVNKGIPLPVVQKLARHSDIRTTMRYAHTDLDDLRRAVDGMDQKPPPENGDGQQPKQS